MPSSQASTHFGFLAARQVVHLGRAAFCDAHRPDIPVAETTQIAADDLLPQFGFVGKRYEKRRCCQKPCPCVETVASRGRYRAKQSFFAVQLNVAVQ
jgi:hypothetical protein